MSSVSELTELAEQFCSAAAHNSSPGDHVARSLMRVKRNVIAYSISMADPTTIEQALAGKLSDMVFSCIDAGLRSEQRIDIERQILEQCLNQSSEVWSSRNIVTVGLAAALLSWHVCELDFIPRFELIPPAARPVWIALLFETPAAFANLGDADQYVRYLGLLCNRVVEYLRVAGSEGEDVIAGFCGSSMFAQSYFSEKNLRKVMMARATVIEKILERNGSKLDQLRVISTMRSRPRIGFISFSVSDGTETVFLISHLEHIDRTRFDTKLFSMFPPQGIVGGMCMSSVDRYLQLSTSVTDAVSRLRQEDLDIAVFCTNLTAVNSWITQVSAHRVARVQVTTIASPVTTGFRNMDVMISGRANETSDSPSHYSERLVEMEGSLNCYPFQYMLRSFQPTTQITRSSLNVPETATLFCTAANYYKILPELSELWIRILLNVKGSILMMLPFNPSWSSNYRREPFIARWQRQLREVGLSLDQIRIVECQPTIADLHAVLKLGDVYLDPYPFSGACSVFDAFEAGVPIVARKGQVCRSRHSGAMLTEAGMEDWVTVSDTEYLELAISWGKSSDERKRQADRITTLRAKGFPFADTKRYSEKLHPVLIKVEDEWNIYTSDLHRKVSEPMAQCEFHSLSCEASRYIESFTDLDMIVEVILPYLRNTDGRRLLVDVGGHYGVMTRPFLVEGWQSIMFEPDSRCHPYLESLKAQFVGNVHYEAAAVSPDKEGSIIFHIADLPGLSGLAGSPYASDQKVLEVPCLILQDYIVRNKIEDVSFIKIDAEGFDFEILESLDFKVLSPKIIMVEFGQQFEGQDRESVVSLLSRMRQKGYRSAVFCFVALGDFHKHQWQTRLHSVVVDSLPEIFEIEQLFGNIIFFQEADKYFVPSVWAWLERKIPRLH
jgi:FkbM family methyltransferase